MSTIFKFLVVLNSINFPRSDKENGEEICRIINESANYNENAMIIMLNLLALATGQAYEVLEERFQKAIK